jgi:GT2 family glycosyltransferase
VLTLNNDTEADPALVERLRAAAGAAPQDVGMIQPRLVLRGRRRLNSTGVVVHRDGSANDRDFGAPLDAREDPDEILCVTAGAGLYRRAMLEGTRLPGGYFDPSFFMYFEDVDLGWRCRLAGWSARYVPGAHVEHAFQGSSVRHGPHFVTSQCMRNRVRTLLKNASWLLILRSLPRTASDLLWLLQHARGRALADWIEAVGAGARQRPGVTALLRQGRRDLEQRWVPGPVGEARAQARLEGRARARRRTRADAALRGS